MEESLIVLFSGAAGAALIKLIDGIIQHRLNRKAKKEDDAEDKKDAIDIKIDNMTNCMRIMMLEHIQDLCERYIKAGEINIHALRRLHIMHEAYHSVNGNGDLDDLMLKVDELPIIPIK